MGMLELKYISHDTAYKVEFELVKRNIVRLVGDIPADTSGFTLSRIGYDDRWDHSGFKTVYRKGDGFIEYSNDGSTHVEPEPQPETDPIPSEPSHEDRIAALEAQLAAYEAAYQEGVNGA